MSMMETYRTRSGPMNPTGVPPASFDAWQALVAPGDVFKASNKTVFGALGGDGETAPSRWPLGRDRTAAAA